MFQDIDPHTLVFERDLGGIRDTDLILVLRDGLVLLASGGGRLELPTFGELRPALRGQADDPTYLFSVGQTALYYCPAEIGPFGPFAYASPRLVRELAPKHLAFACATAFHLSGWHAANRYCGRCAGPMRPKGDDRALACPGCGLVKYPRISPVVIVGVRNGESLLLAKSAVGEYRNYGLIAGFVEPGETLEGATAREVMEEVGLQVANARYYKSQPWAFSQSLLMGFFADLAGEASITLDTGELSEARWFDRSELPADESRFSLTWDMIQAFRNGEV